MKKLFVAVALVMGLGTSVVFAENFHTNVDSVALINEFKPIDVKDLPQAVQDAIAKGAQRKNLRSKPYKIVSLQTTNHQQLWKQTVIASFFLKEHWITFSSQM